MTATDSQATEGNRLTIRYGIRWDGRGRPKPVRMAALGLLAIALLLPAWAAERGLPRDMESLAQTAEVRELVQGIVDGVNADRSRYEQVKRFAILPRDFTMDDDELTPTLKLKRRVVAEHFASELEDLYEGETLNQAAGV